jgi:hypothetical protein
MITLYRRPKLTGLRWLLDRVVLYMIAIVISLAASIFTAPVYEELSVEEMYKIDMEFNK